LIIAKESGVPIDRVVFADLQDADFPEMKDMLDKLQNYIGLEFEIREVFSRSELSVSC
jgi:hypothetical protein